MSRLTLETSIGRFPPSKYHDLCKMLNIGEAWKKLAEVVPNRKGTGLRFTTDDVLTFEMLRDPSESLLNSWSTDCVTFGTLIHWLSVAELKRQACFVRSTVDPNFSPAPDCNPCDCPRCGDYTPLTDMAPRNPASGNYVQLQQPDTPNCFPGCTPSYRYAMLSSWTNNFNRLPLRAGGNLLGEGGYAEVFKGIDSLSGKMVAIKRMKIKLEDSSKDTKHSSKQQLENEIKVLSHLEHDNIVQLLGCSMDGPSHCLIYEYIACGSLDDRLACRHYTPPLRAVQRIYIAQDTAHGLVYLHTQNYIHMDVKSANILLDGNLRAKVGDYGITRLGPSSPDKTSTQTNVVIGTTVYIAPEIHIGGRVSFKADSYSYGVVLLELLTGLPSYNKDREDPSLVMHVRENCSDDEMEILDDRADDWNTVDAQRVFQLSQRLLADYKRRPALCEVQDEINSWTYETQPKSE